MENLDDCQCHKIPPNQMSHYISKYIFVILEGLKMPQHLNQVTTSPTKVKVCFKKFTRPRIFMSDQDCKLLDSSACRTWFLLEHWWDDIFTLIGNFDGSPTHGIRVLIWLLDVCWWLVCRWVCLQEVLWKSTVLIISWFIPFAWKKLVLIKTLISR